MKNEFRTGERVLLSCEGRTVPARIVLASQNGRSLMLEFDAIIAGCVGMMPVLQDEAGAWASVMTGTPLTIARPDTTDTEDWP
jgi:hypothetical protein